MQFWTFVVCLCVSGSLGFTIKPIVWHLKENENKHILLNEVSKSRESDLGYQDVMQNDAPQGQCSQLQFPCDDGECIKKNEWCNTLEDCTDGSDEKYCEKYKKGGWFEDLDPNKCPKTRYFLCGDGPCIPAVGKCDGTASCKDGSDEKNCSDNNTETTLPSSLPSESPSSVSTTETAKTSASSTTQLAVQNKELTTETSLHLSDYSSQIKTALDWLISKRDEEFGWGAFTPRAVVALFLNRDPSYIKKTEDMLMKKQLYIQLAIELEKNHTKPMSLSDLSLYINALMVTCSDPRNFYGHDLVTILRGRVNTLRTRLASPLAYLTLCVANETSYVDSYHLRNMVSDASIKKKLDLQSLAIMAASCVASSREDHIGLKTAYKNASIYLAREVKKDGLPGNVYEMSLLIQALNESKVQDFSELLNRAMEFIVKEQVNDSFEDILGTYHALPVLSGKSLLSIRNLCKESSDRDMTAIDVLKNTDMGHIFVHFSLYMGYPVEVIQTLQLAIRKGCNFLDVMRLAQDINPNFRFKLDKYKKDPFVYSIGGMPNDAERGLYWKLFVAHTGQRVSEATLRPFHESLKSLKPANGDEIVFWRRHD